MKTYRSRGGIALALFCSAVLIALSACQSAPSGQRPATLNSPYQTTPSAIATASNQFWSISLSVQRHAGAAQSKPSSANSSPAGPAASAAPVYSGTGPIPTAFPRYFSFGSMNNPGEASTLDGMRSSNGASFAFRYQYLTGGVNTGHGWETWNSPAGQYATNYMQESAQHGYIPAFVYYEICLSNGPQPSSYCGGHNVQQDTGNLASSATMNAYFANWALLMQKIGAFGKPALVIVEPDLWGFLQNASSSATSVPASVGSSGYPDAAGYPNSAQGFAWALLHMRDKYARNAILALHASTWAAGADIAVDTRPDLDVAGVVQREAAFLNSAGLVGNPAGVSTWDLLSNDVADFDSAQPGGRSWWDRYNRTFPNFARYLTYIKGLSSATHRRVAMWQVPVGNQYFDTMNNTPGHYQDNRAEYILGNVPDFAAAGVIAVLFGPGNSGTSNTDAMHDGVTNPAPVNSYECNACNNHTSSYPDDDGGYLRIFVGQYMKHPVSIG